MFGLLRMLQAMKHGSGQACRAFTTKLTPMPTSRGVQRIGFNVQFVGHATTSGALFVTIEITMCKMTLP